ncbi:class I SAM-dependent methyltransferase [Nocardioides sp. zg-536]|uniref:Class I SAM-dependent methyltransferase n=1 Tax=Nocardioides faecalis TaxID=2803858 RepID=A0A938Y2A5_9ACTN|nr:class I SAM-dependent methyltransferase [Nocardioides faecalis]MBM9460546.1 class I SAM-dependent methyltransferase [Nocardioides faecalis]MBS4754391.1 class I SAM-dependent methyltransferase [Nocardioides faecalis]QVI57522.1 class I SAM-dependent methyltransferase [Nocardioides faecalis]
MDAAEIAKSAALERTHWWYAARRALVRRTVADWPAGRAIDVGCGMGGNTLVLRQLGWRAVGVEYSETGAEIAAARGIPVLRGDGRRLPVADSSVDLVMSTDAWEHIDDDVAVAAETFRVLRPGGRALIAVPAGMDLWSGHDVALGHVRRYERDELVARITGAGLVIEDLASWNVLLRPVVRMRRRDRQAPESEMEAVHPVLNAGLRAAIALERVLPVRRWPGVSLVAVARKP